ncbi:MAG TPA: cytochrome C oxidase subunit IV family protein [Bacteroidia bacterium]|jgi:cytochrome c oxidase subunit 4|nr:cytochrome C oxidase subunit IV family protein [Bacteroidia bacterium]
MEFHDDYPQYETMYQHDEAHGKQIRSKLWKVFWLLLAITLLELFVGFKATSWGLLGSTFLKFFFIFFTLVKAGGIVLVFMHLIDETKFFRYTILLPYSVFILYLIFIILVEGTYCGYPLNKTSLDKNYKIQQIVLRKHHKQPIPAELTDGISEKDIAAAEAAASTEEHAE